MAVETVFNATPVKEPPAPRRRSAEAGDGQGFSLPQAQEEASAVQEREPSAAGDGKTGGTTVPQAADGAAKAVAKTDRQDKPADAAAGPRQKPATQSGSLIDALAELLAGAQGEAAPSAQGGAEEAGATGTADKKDADGKKAGEKGDSTETAAVDKAGEAAVVAAAADQNTAAQPGAALLALSLPEVASGDPAAKGAAAEAGAGLKASTPAPAVLAARAGQTGLPETGAGEPAAGSQAAGKYGAAGAAHQAAASDAPATAAKTEAGQGVPPAQGQLPAPVEARPAEAVQQALAPIDLGALVQQALGGADSARLLPQPGQAAAAANQAAVPGQGQAAPPATPLHVLPIEIGLRALAGARQFDIRLDPGELGRVDVNLSISDRGEVSARLVVDRVETLHLLQRDARTLERAFEQAGLKPSDGGVDISLRDSSDQSAFRQQRQQDEAPQQRWRQPSSAETGEDAVLPATPVPERRLVRLGGVDLSI